MNDHSGNRLFILLFSLFLGLGPIYWIPWFDKDLINIFKLTLFFAITVRPIVYFFKSGQLYFPGGRLVFNLIVIFISLSIPGMVFGEFSESIYRLQNQFQILLFLFLCGYLIQQKIVQPVMRLTAIFFLIFCIASLILMLLTPDYPSPLNDQLSLSQTGFGGSRTSWSPAIALYLPWFYAGFSILKIKYAWLAVLSMISNQVMVGGRTGMIAAVLPFLVFGILRKSAKIFFFVAAVLLVMIFLGLNNLELLRLDSGGLTSRSALDDLSTGRVDMYFDAFNSIMENPIFGSGFGFDLGYGINEAYFVHNVILRAAVEAGILYALVLTAIIVIAIYRGGHSLEKRDWFVFSSFLTVLAGVVNSFFEPVAMIGNFYSAAFWWCCFAVCVSTNNLGESNKERLL